MQTICPTPYLPPGCWDITKAAGFDATLAGLLATIAAAAIILVLQAPKRSSFERETRNTVLSVLVSTFLSALLASFIFGLLSGEMPSIRAEVLINLASPALVVGVLQFLLSIGWLLTSHQAEAATLSIARWAFLLVNGLVVVYLALDWEDLLELKTPGAVPPPVWTFAGILGALLMGIIAWTVTTRLKRGFSSEVSRRQKGASYAHRCAKSGLFFAAGSALLYGVISDFPASILQDGPAWVYYLGILSLMVLMTWFLYVSEMSWPPLPPASSPAPQENHAAAILDEKLSGETISLPPEKSTTSSAKKRSVKKSANLDDKNSNKA
jgi:hypothetical protein